MKRLLLILSTFFVFIQAYCAKGVDFNGGLVVDSRIDPSITCAKTGGEYKINVTEGVYKTYVKWNTSNSKKDADAVGIAVEKLILTFTDGSKKEEIIRVAYKNDSYSNPTKFGYDDYIDKLASTGTSSVDELGPGGKKVEFEWTFTDYTQTFSSKELENREIKKVSIFIWCAVRARSRDNGASHETSLNISDLTSISVSDCGGFDGKPLYSYFVGDVYIAMQTDGGIQWITTEENVVNDKLKVSYNTTDYFSNTSGERANNRHRVVNNCELDKYNTFTYKWKSTECGEKSNVISYYAISRPKFGSSIQRYNNNKTCKEININGDSLIYKNPSGLTLDSAFFNTSYTWQYYDEKQKEWYDVADLFNWSDVEGFLIDKNLSVDFSKAQFSFNEIILRQVGTLNIYDQTIYSDPITIKFYDQISDSDLTWKSDIDYLVCEDGSFGHTADLVNLSSEKDFKQDISLSYYASAIKDTSKKEILTSDTKFGEFNKLLVKANSGCNTITKEKALSVYMLPTFPSDIVRRIDIKTYLDSKHDEIDQNSGLLINEPVFTEYGTDTDNYNSEFEISVNKGKTFTITGLEQGDYIVNDSIYKDVNSIDIFVNESSKFNIYKLNSLGCQSKTSIYVKVNVYGDINGNKPYQGKSIIYNCPNIDITTDEIDALFEPAVYADNKEKEPEYLYQYRKLGYSEWYQFNNNYVPFENYAIQVQRVAYFGKANDKFSSSNIITIYPISKPTIALSTDNKNFNTSKIDLCFYDSLYAKILSTNVDTTKSIYWRIDNGDLLVLGKPINGVYKLTSGIGSGVKNISLAVCDGTVFSNSVKASAPDTLILDIRGDLQINTECVNAGDTIKIKRNNISDNADYFFLQNNETSLSVVLSETTKYLNVVKSQNGCNVEDTVRVKVDKTINPTKLRIGNDTYDSGATIEVCADKSITLTSENPTDNLLYSFKDITNSNDVEYSIATNKPQYLSFDKKDNLYTILRQSQVNKQCFGKVDTFFFKTYPEFNFVLDATSSAGKSSTNERTGRNIFSPYCKGDGDTITFTSNSISREGGSGEYIYHVSSSSKPDSAIFSGDFDGSFSIEFPEVTRNSYYVRIYDRNCPSYWSTYSYTYMGSTGEATGLSFSNIVDINDFSNVTYTDGSGNTDIKDLKKGKGETDWEITVNDNIGTRWNYIVSAVGLNSEPETPSCPKSRPETESTVIITPDNTDASLTLYRWAFLDDCKTQCSASIDIPFHCSNGWGNIDQFGIALNTDGEEKQTIYVGCDGSTVKVTTDIEDLPKTKGGLFYDINSFSDIESKVSYQWQQKIGNSYWLNIEGATKSSAEIEINSNEVKYVRCIITYNGDKLTSNNTITIYSEQTVKSVPLYGVNNTTSTKVCEGSSINALYLELSKEYPIATTGKTTNIQYVWEYSTDNKNWSVLGNDKTQEFYISETNSYKTDFFANKIDKETYIRCGIKFNSCPTTVYSYLYTIKIDDSINRYPLHDKNGISYVRLISNPIINGSAGSLEFVTNYQVDEYKSSYTWGAVTEERSKFINVDSLSRVSVSTKEWGLEYFSAGLHQATIQKKHIEGCESAIDTFSYELFEQMSVTNLNDSIFEYNLCKLDTIKSIIISGYGGDYREDVKPQIQWYIKSGSYEGSIEKANIYLHYDSITIETHKGAFSFLINGLVAYQDLSLYATIHSGNYPVDITTPIITVNVIPELKASGVYNDGGSICYNTLPILTEKEKSTGGTGNYTYSWQRSFDDKETWEDLTNEGGETYTGVSTESLKANAWYRRIVSENCTSSLSVGENANKYITSYSNPEKYYSSSSDVKVIVKDSFYTDADKVLLNIKDKTIVVATNEEINIKYNTTASSHIQSSYFVIRNDNNEIIDTLVSKEKLDENITSNIVATDKAKYKEGNYYYTLTKYNKLDNCPSFSDTFVVAVIDGGVIEFENLTKVKKNEYWMCRMDSIGVIKSLNRSDKINRYQWFMFDENERKGYYLNSKESNIQVNTESVNVDNTNVATIIKGDDFDGEEKLFKFVREGFYEGSTKPVSSDTLYLHVAGNIKNQDLTVSISPKYAEICGDVDRINIDVEIDSSAIADKNFGALKFFSNKGAGDSNGKTFRTYWESAYGNGQDGIKDELWGKIDGSENFATRFNRTQSLEINDITVDKMSYRFVMDDGCTRNYTYASVSVLEYDSIGSFIFEKYDESAKKFISTDYIEIGDSIRIVYKHISGSSPKVNWYDSEECDSCKVFSANSDDLQNHFTIGNVKESDQLYISLDIQGEIMGNTCEGKRERVPLVVYPSCNGGKIVANEDKICKDGDYSIINSYLPASGGDGKFEYSWQYSFDLDKNSWSTIENSNNVYLEADLLNSVTKGNDVIYIRRKATNRGGGNVFSNTVTLERYEEFISGSLSFSDSVNKADFCFDDMDSIPTIVSTLPIGGKGKETGYTYMWAIAVNSLAFDTIKSENSNSFAISKHLDELKIDSLNENSIQVKCIYNDTYNMCNSVESEPITFIIHSQVQTPSIHQGGNDCDSELALICVDDSINYTYKWNQYHDGGVFSGEVDNCIKLFRKGQGVVDVIEYGVVGTHKITGCKTKEYRFNPNTIPVLQQQEIIEIDTICFGSDFIINLPSATGGVGDKKYQWLQSEDDEIYTEITDGNSPALTLHSVSKMSYYKRVVTDACNEIITDAIKINVSDTIKQISVDISNYQCQGSDITVSISDSTTNGNILRVYNLTALGSLDGKLSDHDIELNETNKVGVISGFNSDVNTYAYTTFDSKLKCHSSIVKKDVINKPHVKASYANINADSYTPCNETKFTIIGENAVETSLIGYVLNGDKEDVGFKYKWYTSKDGKDFGLVSNENKKDLTLEIVDTLYVTRIVDNTCGETATSDTLKFVGKKLLEFAPQMEVITSYVNNADGEVTIKSSSFANCILSGDGGADTINTSGIKYGVVLPYSAKRYQDSMLYVLNTSGECYRPFRIKPLMGNKIDTDCKDMTITASNIEGLNDDATLISSVWSIQQVNLGEWYEINDNNGYKIDDLGNIIISSDDKGRSFRKDVSYQASDNLVYVINSNILYASLSAPELSVITMDSSSSYVRKINYHYIQKLRNQKVVLVDTIVGNYNKIVLEISTDSKKYVESGSLEVHNGIVRFDALDNVNASYRIVATNSCGINTSESFYVENIEEKFIDDDDIEIIPAKCKGDNAFIRCYDNANHGTGRYDYSYEFIPHKGASYSRLYAIDKYFEDGSFFDDGSRYEQGKTQRQICVFGVNGNIEVLITRYDTETGVNAIKQVTLYQDSVKSDFSLSLDNRNITYSYSELEEIDINEGERISLINSSENATKYSWDIHWHDHPFIENSKGQYDMKTDNENPSMYVYSEGYYDIILVASNENCKDTLRYNNALFIAQSGNNTLRSATMPMMFFNLENPNGKDDESNSNVISIFPIPFDSELHIDYKDDFDYFIFNELGKEIAVGSATDHVVISTAQFPIGSYIIKVNDVVTKAIKK